MSSSIANISLYIPHVFANIHRKRVVDTFENLRIGNVKRADIVSKRSANGEHYNSVYIHFNYWYDNIAARNFQERVLDTTREARIVYDEPWYWIVLENKAKKHVSGDRKPRVVLDLQEEEVAAPAKTVITQVVGVAPAKEAGAAGAANWACNVRGGKSRTTRNKPLVKIRHHRGGHATQLCVSVVDNDHEEIRLTWGGASQSDGP